MPDARSQVTIGQQGRRRWSGPAAGVLSTLPANTYSGRVGVGVLAVVVVVDLDVVRAWLDVSVVGSAVSVESGSLSTVVGEGSVASISGESVTEPSLDPISRSINDVATVVSSLVVEPVPDKPAPDIPVPDGVAAVVDDSALGEVSVGVGSDSVGIVGTEVLSVLGVGSGVAVSTGGVVTGSGGTGSVGTTTGVGSGVTGAGVGVTGAGATGAGFGNGRMRGMFGT